MKNNVTKKYPRVLVVSAAALNTSSAGGITMTNLFKGWPLDSIAQVFWDDFKPMSETCISSWRISHNDVPLVNAVRRIVHSLNSFKAFVKSIMLGATHVIKSQLLFENSILSPTPATAWADIINTRLSYDFWHWIDEYKPEVIYSLLGSIRVMNVVLQVSKRLSIPIVPHFMDDWPSTLYIKSFSNKIPRAILVSCLKDVLNKSPYCMAISGMMAEEYQALYDKKFEAFMNCVDIVNIPQTFVRNINNTITFAYVGGLHLNRWQSLLQVGDALVKLKQDGYNAELVVFAPPSDIAKYGHILKANMTVRIGGSLTPDEILPTLQHFDVLVHIESFDKQVRQYTRLSISTKIPQYMASGRPILAYGPDEVASCRYVLKQDCGLVVSDEDQVNLIAALRKLVESAALRQHLGQHGRQAALINHNGNIERERFMKTLLKSITMATNT